ncbi:MAG: CHASE3 domain-containing protein, partial [Phormidesmis sp.]
MRRFWQGLSITRRGAFILMLPTFFTISSLINWAWSRRQERVASDWVTHTENVLKESSQLLTLLVDAETGVRGYGLTQDAAFLAPYEVATRSIPARFEQLNRLTPDDSPQQVRLERIGTEIDDYLALLRATCLLLGDLENSQVANSPELLTMIQQGKTDLDRLRNDLNRLRTEEQDLLSLRRQELMMTKRFVDRLLAVTVLLSLLSYAVAFYLYRQADLEVMTRNRQLETANESLSQFNIALAKRNQELDEFTHTVSHDLKAPLRAIDNLSGWIAEDLDLPAESEVGR